MAVIQYSNGIIEDFKAENLTFSDKEFLDILKDYDDIRTLRLIEISNTWCVWGHNTKSSDDTPLEFNRIGSSIVDEDIFSPLLIVHDGELDPDWNLNDTIILNTYKEFKDSVVLFINDIAQNVLDLEQESNSLDDDSSDNTNLMVLTPLGPTRDKKVLFELNIDKQSKEFLNPPNFEQFAQKVIDYWNQFFIENIDMDDNTCVIYADSKTIIIIQDDEVKYLTELLVRFFESVEDYETCSNLHKYYNAWVLYIKNNKKVDNPKQIPQKIKNQDIDTNFDEES